MASCKKAYPSSLHEGAFPSLSHIKLGLPRDQGISLGAGFVVNSPGIPLGGASAFGIPPGGSGGRVLSGGIPRSGSPSVGGNVDRNTFGGSPKSLHPKNSSFFS